MPVVFDNLIHKRDMPVTIGIFVNPGVVPPPDGALPRFNRSVEYDSVTDRYARFLLDEILPEVARPTSCDRRQQRAICGTSSGAISAFTAAWERPDAFSRVFSTIGTYVGLRGGNDLPTLVSKDRAEAVARVPAGRLERLEQPRRPLVSREPGDARGLRVRRLRRTHAWGDGAHDSKHGASILPDALRWLWRGYPRQSRLPASRSNPS